MAIYVFKCPNNHKHEDIVPMGTTEHLCPDCGATAVKAGSENFLQAVHGLVNGHIGVGRKLTGSRILESKSGGNGVDIVEAG